MKQNTATSLRPNNESPETAELALRIRKHAVRMTNLGGSSHVGSVLSMADIVAVLYGGILRIDPSNPERADRDRFILSKGHAGAGIYAALAGRDSSRPSYSISTALMDPF
jgi:Transketolase, N-terminal subunit